MNDISNYYQNEPKSGLLRKPSIKKSQYHLGRSCMKKDERKGLNISVIELDKSGRDGSETSNFGSDKSEVSACSDSEEEKSSADECSNALGSNDYNVHRILSMKPKQSIGGAKLRR